MVSLPPVVYIVYGDRESYVKFSSEWKYVQFDESDIFSHFLSSDCCSGAWQCRALNCGEDRMRWCSVAPDRSAASWKGSVPASGECVSCIPTTWRASLVASASASPSASISFMVVAGTAARPTTVQSLDRSYLQASCRRRLCGGPVLVKFNIFFQAWFDGKGLRQGPLKFFV